MHKKISLGALMFSSLLITACTTTPETQLAEVDMPKAEQGLINNYPTRDRVEYVFNCIAKHGDDLLDYVPRYNCGCKIDKIAEKLTFLEYEAATTFTMLRSTPGENGSVFRDPKQSKSLRKRLKEAEAYAESACFV